MQSKNIVRACHQHVETLKSNGFSVRRIAFYGIRTRRTMPVACYPCFAFSPPPALYPKHSKYPWWIIFDSNEYATGVSGSSDLVTEPSLNSGNDDYAEFLKIIP